MNELANSTHTIWESVTKALIKKNITISTMESCTGGLIASLITNTPHASQIFPGSCVTYNNAEKIKNGVDAEVIKKYGVYSAETATEMAKACRKTHNTEIGIGITGVLDRIDPNNVTITKNVYFTITTSIESVTGSIVIPEDIDNRFERKLYVAKAIGLFLYNMYINNTYF